MPSASLALVERHLQDVRIPLTLDHPWHVLVDYVASSDAQAQFGALLGDAMEAGLFMDAILASNEAQAETGVLAPAATPSLQQSAPLARPSSMIFPCLSKTCRISWCRQLTSSSAHFRACQRPPSAILAMVTSTSMSARRRCRQKTLRPGGQGRGNRRARWVYDLTVAANGSISAEHGIGQMKAGGAPALVFAHPDFGVAGHQSRP